MRIGELVALTLLAAPFWMPLLLAWWMPRAWAGRLVVMGGVLWAPAFVFSIANLRDGSRYHVEGVVVCGGGMMLFVGTLTTWLAVWLGERGEASDGGEAASRCVKCGYDLRGSAEAGRCPECGEGFEASATGRF